jgi:1-phosphofructokinase family hexose kinase
MKSFLVVCLNPTIQRTYLLDDWEEGEVNRCSEHYLDASGKGVNVSRVLRQLGAEVIHLTHAGGRFRDLFVELTEQEGIQLRVPDSFSEIRFCNTLVNTSKATTTEIVEEGPKIGKGVEESVMGCFADSLSECGTVILIGSKAEGYSDRIFPEMVRIAKGQGHRVVLDYRGQDLVNSLEHRPDVIKPNFSEFAATFLEVEAEEQADNQALLAPVKQKMQELWQDSGTRTVLTRGSREILCFSEAGFETYRPRALDPVNTIGCGDSMCAGMALALEEGQSLREAIGKGAECAALCALNKRPGSIV